MQTTAGPEEGAAQNYTVEDAKQRVIEADRKLNTAKQVAEVFVEHKDPEVAKSIRELRECYESVRLVVFDANLVDTQDFSDMVDRKKNIRAEVQEGLIRLLRSYSSD